MQAITSEGRWVKATVKKVGGLGQLVEIREALLQDHSRTCILPKAGGKCWLALVHFSGLSNDNDMWLPYVPGGRLCLTCEGGIVGLKDDIQVIDYHKISDVH